MYRPLKKLNGHHWAMGIDIGNHATKAILLEQDTDTIVAHYAAHVPTPPDALQNGVLVGQREVAAQLRQIVRQSGFDIRTASLAIPIDQLIVRSIDLPAMDGDALRTATRFEARKYLPYPVDQAEVVIIPLGQTTDSEGTPRMRALLAAAPRAVVRSRAETLEMAGLEVASIDIEPLSLMRAFSIHDTQQGMIRGGQPFVYVHLGQKSSGMCVIQDTNLRFVHAISWGSSRLTQALATSLDCTPEEARAIKESRDAAISLDGNFSWGTPDDRHESGVLMPEFERLGREMQRLLNYYRSLYPERSYEGILDRLIISGGEANVKGINSFFSELFKLEVIVRNPFQSFETRLQSASFLAIDGHNHSFSVAIGLALGSLHSTAALKQSSARSAQEIVWRRNAA